MFIRLFTLITALLVIGGCQKAPKTTTISDPATSLELIPDPELVLAGFCSKANEVFAVDVNRNPTNLVYSQTIRLNASIPGTYFYEDEECTIPRNTVTIPAGSNKAVFYFKTEKAGYLSITSSNPTLNSSTQAKTIVSPFASELRISGESQLIAGECSTEYKVETLDYQGLESNTQEDLTISLTGAGAGRFYSTPDCSGTPIETVSILADTNSSSFYFKSNKSGLFSLSVSAPGPITAKKSVSVGSNVQSKLVFLTIPQYIEAGVCSAQYVVNVQDEYGNLVRVSENTNVELSSDSSAEFYLSSDCEGTPINQVEIEAGKDNFSFYVKSNIVGEDTVRVSSFASQAQTLTVSSSRPVELRLPSLPSIMTAGNIFDRINVTIHDRFGNLVQDSNSLVSIAAYSDPECQTLASSQLEGFAQVNAVNGIAGFISLSYRKAEEIYIGVKSTSLTPSCSSKIEVIPDFPSRLIVDEFPTVIAGSCTPIQLITADKFGNRTQLINNTTISLVGGPSEFYTNNDCDGSIVNSITIPAINDNYMIYYKNRVSGVFRVTLSGLGTTPFESDVTVIPATPKKFVLTGSSEVIAGDCSPGFSIKTLDEFNNDSPIPLDSEFLEFTVNLNGSNGAFYHDSSCSSSLILNGGSATGTINKGEFRKNLYFRNHNAEISTFTFTAKINGDSKSESLTIRTNPGVASHLHFSDFNSVIAGVGFDGLKLTIKDSSGNVALSYNKPITITAYSDSACSRPSSVSLNGTVTKIPVGGEVSFSETSYTKAEVIYIGAKGEGLVDACSQAVTVNSADPSKIIVSGPEELIAGSCSEINLFTHDAYGNKAKNDQNRVISLDHQGEGSFYLNATCSGSPVNSVNIPSNQFESKVYYKNAVSGIYSLTASIPQHESAIFNLNVIPSAPKKIVFSGPTTLKADECSAEIKIAAQDVYSNEAPVSFDTRVILTHTGEGSFYSDPSCSREISSLTIPANRATWGFYFKNQKAETSTFEGTALTFDTGIFAITTTPLPPKKLIVNAPSTVIAGTCNAINLATRDEFDNDSPVTQNTSFALSGLTSGGFYSSSSCTGTPATTITMANGSQQRQLYYRGDMVGDISGTVTAFSESQTVNLKVLAAAPNKVVFASEPKTIQSGTCSGAVLIQLKDAFNNNTAATSNLSVSLNGANVQFYATQGCAGSPISSIQIPKDGETAIVYVTSNTTSANQISITALSKTETQPLTVTPTLTAVDDEFSVQQDQILYISTSNLTANDWGVPGTTFSVVSISDQIGGTVSLSGQNISFDPNVLTGEPASFKYTIRDSKGNMSTATVTINVTPLPRILALIYDVDEYSLVQSLLQSPPPTMREMFDSWGRFSNNAFYANRASASGEAASWKFETNPDRVISTINSTTHTGFVSPNKIENYTMDVTLSSTDSDDDFIAVVIAFNREGNQNNSLVVWRTQGQQGSATSAGFGVYYNYGQNGAWLMTSKSVDGTKGRWKGYTSKIRVQRTGDLIQVFASNWNATNVNPASLITIDLNSDSRLHKFKGPQSYGFSAQSQLNSTFTNLELVSGEELNQNIIFDLATNRIWEYKNNAWTISTSSFKDKLGYPREIYNPKTGRTYYIDADGFVTPMY